MKMLSNSRGVALVVLVVAMTLIAILGASFVSLMGSKQKGFLYQIDSYRAFNIANAGTEYAIRYLSDSAQNTQSSFFQNPSIYENPSAPVTQNFGDGSFFFHYTFATDTLSVTGTTPKGSSRKLNLTNFRRYLSSLTLVYEPPASSRSPFTYSEQYPDSVSSTSVPTTVVVIPIFNNSGSDVNVFRLDVVMPLGGRVLKNIYFNDTTNIAYSSISDARCPCVTEEGIQLPMGEPATQFTLTGTYSIPSDTMKSYLLRFDQSSFSSPTVQYKVILYYTVGAQTKSSTVMFNL
jgi:hypothetical protein